MKFLFFAGMTVLITNVVAAQPHYLDSLHYRLEKSIDDTTRVRALDKLAIYYAFNRYDSAIFYAQHTLDLAKKINYTHGQYLGMRDFFYPYNTQGNYTKALEITLECFKIAEKIKKEYPFNMVQVHYFLAVLNRQMENYPVALTEMRTSIQLMKENGIPEEHSFPSFSQLALIYQKLNNLDSALWYAQKGYDLSLQPNMWYPRFICLPAAVLGLIHTELHHYEVARNYLWQGIQQARMDNNIFFLAWNDNLLADLYDKTGFADSCIYYAKLSLQLWPEHNFGVWARNASTLLTKVYESQHQPDSAIKYMRIMLAARDSVFNQKRVKEFERFVFDEQQQRQERQKEQEQYKAKIKTYALLASMVGLLLIGFVILHNISLKRKNEANRREIAENELQLQKMESERTRVELQQEATELEMQALRAQMNPHFIFNCLSSINHYILQNDSEMASGYLTKFSRLIRMVLNNSKNPLINLDDELEMLRLYLDLEKLRFDNSFNYSINFHAQFDTSSIFIPPLLLQPFAENAIWHGLMNKKGQGMLEISFELDDHVLNCYITDNGIGRKNAETLKRKLGEKQKSMGMQITADRLALFNNDDEQTIFSVEDLVGADGQPAGTKVTLKIRFKETLEEYSL
jgi:hypothetical protein